jgi:hypothetical protein
VQRGRLCSRSTLQIRLDENSYAPYYNERAKTSFIGPRGIVVGSRQVILMSDLEFTSPSIPHSHSRILDFVKESPVLLLCTCCFPTVS